VEQPGEEEGFASKVKIRSYPVKEYLGLIFAYLGEGEPPPLRRYPELERPGVFETNTPEYWPCNYYNRLDNACDAVHVAYTHRESGMRAKRPERLGIGTLTAEETEYGVKTTYFLANQPSVELRFHMPNTNQTRSFLRVEGSLEDAAKLIADRLFWRVPVDDENCVSFVVDLVPVTGKDVEAYNKRRLEARETIKEVSPNELASQILTGKLNFDEIDLATPIYYLFWIEDYAVQVGQGPVAPRAEDTLGRMDRGVLLMRKLWERELKAFADGRTLKPWKSPAEFSRAS
jgi:5,5'-dehydrodivanillate O-demethylase